MLNADMKCLHAKTPFDRAYMRKRKDLTVGDAILRHRYHRDEQPPKPG